MWEGELPIPDYQTLMLPLLKRAALGEIRVLDAEKQLAEEVGLTPEERDQLLPTKKQRVLLNRAHWAKFYMSKAGLVSTPRRGTFIATDAGRQLLATNPSHIDVDLLRQYPSFEEFYKGGPADEGQVSANTTAVSPPSAVPQSTPEEQIKRAFVTLQSALRTDLLERIFENSPTFFEELIIDLLVRMGYGGSRPDAAMQLGRSCDGGVDGVINEDRLGLDRVYVQAKRYAEGNVIGRPAVQNFVGSLVGMGATKGVFVTTSKFSGEAVEFARHLTQRVILIDGRRLTELMIEHGVGVRLNRAIEFKKIDEDYFDEEDWLTAPVAKFAAVQPATPIPSKFSKTVLKWEISGWKGNIPVELYERSDPEDPTRIKLKPLMDLPARVRRAITRIKVDPETGRPFELFLTDKVQVAALLMRSLMGSDGANVSVNIALGARLDAALGRVSPEQQRILARAMDPLAAEGNDVVDVGGTGPEPASR
jgi:restriction system protein